MEVGKCCVCLIPAFDSSYFELYLFFFIFDSLAGGCENSWACLLTGLVVCFAKLLAYLLDISRLGNLAGCLQHHVFIFFFDIPRIYITLFLASSPCLQNYLQCYAIVHCSRRVIRQLVQAASSHLCLGNKIFLVMAVHI